MDSSNSSSNSMTSSTVSSESAFKSLMKWVSRVISLLSTPICSLTISMTFVSMSSIFHLNLTRFGLGPRGTEKGDNYSGDRHLCNDSHCHSAVHANYLSCHIGRLGGSEKRHTRGDFVCLAEALQRDHSQRDLFHLIDQHIRHVRLDEP